MFDNGAEHLPCTSGSAPGQGGSGNGAHPQPAGAPAAAAGYGPSAAAGGAAAAAMGTAAAADLCQQEMGEQQAIEAMEAEVEAAAQPGMRAASGTGDSESSVIAIAEHCPAALSRDNWSLGVFEIRAKMYSGHISSVYRAVHKTSGITVGLKMYRRGMLNDMERHQIAREIWLHIQLNHPSIIALYAAWKDADHIYLALEWAPEGNVFTFLQQHGGRLPEHVAVPMVLEPTMSALAYIHSLGMIHRDVKPENILLTTSMQIKLADFGLSIHANYEVANTRLGTIDYLSPEILDCPVKQHPADHKANPPKWYTNKVDCWSVGVLAYELLAGHTPFEARTPQETLHKIKTQEVVYPPNLSPGAVDFIKRALVRAPERRVDMSDLLSHSWIRGHMARAALPHPRSRALTQSEAAAGVGALGGMSSGGAGSSGGGGLGGGTPLGLVAGAGSLSLPGGTGLGGFSSGGGARMQSSGAISRAALAGLPAALHEGHNSSCPNITHAQLGSFDGDAMDCSAPLPHPPGLSPLGLCAGSGTAAAAGQGLMVVGGGTGCATAEQGASMRT